MPGRNVMNDAQRQTLNSLVPSPFAFPLGDVVADIDERLERLEVLVANMMAKAKPKAAEVAAGKAAGGDEAPKDESVADSEAPAATKAKSAKKKKE